MLELPHGAYASVSSRIAWYWCLALFTLPLTGRPSLASPDDPERTLVHRLRHMALCTASHRTAMTRTPGIVIVMSAFKARGVGCLLTGRRRRTASYCPKRVDVADCFDTGSAHAASLKLGVMRSSAPCGQAGTMGYPLLPGRPCFLSAACLCQ